MCDDALLLQQALHLEVIIGHLTQLVGACLKAFSKVIAEGKQLDKVFHKKLQDDLFASIDQLRILLEDLDALTQEGQDRHDVVVFPFLDEFHLCKLEVIFLLEISLRC